MAWCRIGGQPLPEPVMVKISNIICLTRPKLIKRNCFWAASPNTETYFCQVFVWPHIRLWNVKEMQLCATRCYGVNNHEKKKHRVHYNDVMCALQWRHNGPDGVSNHRHIECLLNRLFRRRSKKTPKLRVNGLCEGNPPVTGGFPSQRASNTENVSIHDVIMANG